MALGKSTPCLGPLLISKMRSYLTLLAPPAQSAYDDTFIFRLRLAPAPSPDLKGTHRTLLSLREGTCHGLVSEMQGITQK